MEFEIINGFVKPLKKYDYIVELDITTKCNLSCNNCVKLSNYPATWFDMSDKSLNKFIEDNKGKDILIKIIGGEPTIVHNIDEIILKISKEFDCILVTNGINKYVPPIDIPIENSSKQKNTQPEFHTMTEAPIDLTIFKNVDYSKGCGIHDNCGYGYKEGLYYVCPIAPHIPESIVTPVTANSLEGIKNKKQEAFISTCKYCGMFKKMGHHNIDKSKFTRTDKQVISDSWKDTLCNLK